MTEKAKDFHSSFNEDFCVHLEFHLCGTFEHSEDEELSRFWCDGIFWAPFYNDNVNRDYLKFERVSETNTIETTACLGISGQDYYRMTLRLGKQALDNYGKGLSLIDCIPGSDSLEWIDIDIENKTIELRLK